MNKRRHIIPVIVYLSGIGSLFLSDILVTKYLDVEDVSTWAEIRSLIGIASVLCLIGLDQAFIRSPQSSLKLLQALLIQIPLIACLVALMAYFTDINDNWLAVIGLCAGSSGSLALFQFYRTHNKKTASQVAQQGWKILIAILIAFNVVTHQTMNLSNAVAITMLLSLFISVVPILMGAKPLNQNAEELISLYHIGVRFLITSLLLSLAIYGEQLVVSSIGIASDSAYYFTHSTYFLFPISVINGYIAFNIAPWIRDHREEFIGYLKTRRDLVISAAVIYAGIAHVIGWAAWVLLNPGGRPPNGSLQLLLLMSCVLRTFYMLPAGYLGAFGNPKQHDKLIAYQVTSLFLSVLLFCLLFYNFEIHVIHATAAASMLNWMLRALFGFVVVQDIEMSK